MKKCVEVPWLIGLICICPVCCLGATEVNDTSINAGLLSIYNFVLVITTIVSATQFFWTDRDFLKDHSTFHVANTIFAIIFFVLAIWFLSTHTVSYPGFKDLGIAGCIRKFFLGMGFYSVKQLFIAFGIIINMMYVNRMRNYDIAV